MKSKTCMTSKTMKIHFSIEDVSEIFTDLIKNRKKYQSMFENPLLGTLKQLHADYGLKVTLFSYVKFSGLRSIKKTTKKFRKEFEQEADWLKIGFHAYSIGKRYQESDEEEIVRDYKQFLRKYGKIAGRKSIAHILRLEWFEGNEVSLSSLRKMKREPVKVYLAADDDRKSYYLSQKINDYLRHHRVYYDGKNDITFYRTDLRLENVEDMEAKLKEFSGELQKSLSNYLVVFSHENKMGSKNIEKLILLCDWAKGNGYLFDNMEALK